VHAVGNFNLKPLPGETIIPRNYGNAPGSFVVNLRVSRTFQFGEIHRSNAAAARPQGQAAAPVAAAGAGGRGGPSGTGGPMVAGGGGGDAVKRTGGGGPPQGAAPSEKRFTLNASINFQNL
jgi:hypothetical protein